MSPQTAHTIIIGLALLVVGVAVVVDLMKGGDGAAIAAGFTVVGSLVSYEFGSTKAAATPTS